MWLHIYAVYMCVKTVFAHLQNFVNVKKSLSAQYGECFHDTCSLHCVWLHDVCTLFAWANICSSICTRFCVLHCLAWNRLPIYGGVSKLNLKDCRIGQGLDIWWTIEKHDEQQPSAARQLAKSRHPELIPNVVGSAQTSVLLEQTCKGHQHWVCLWIWLGRNLFLWHASSSLMFGVVCCLGAAFGKDTALKNTLHSRSQCRVTKSMPMEHAAMYSSVQKRDCRVGSRLRESLHR